MLNFIIIISKFAFYNILCVMIYLAVIVFMRLRLKSDSKKRNSKRKIVSFIHPFCNDCGGGEKVLWMIVKGINDSRYHPSEIKINILCGIKDDANVINKNLKDRFDIEFKGTSRNKLSDIELVRLKTAHLFQPRPFMTMFFQIIGQIIFAFEIITTVYSDVVIDTTGYPFTYFILKFFGRMHVSSYTHYPFISTDMISDINNGVQGVHSRGIFPKLKLMRYVKLAYYYVILLFYKFNGLFLDFAFCNSSWTYDHMRTIWPSTESEILYPPCSTKLYETSNSNLNRKNTIISFSQFRPEKNHKLQVDIFKKLKDNNFCSDLKLVIIGTRRGEADHKIFNDLQNYIIEKNLDNKDVELCPDLPFDQVRRKFEDAKIGLHTMKDEHFGISIIEMMAAGLITVAHKSAGPLKDIIGPAEEPVGILADCIFFYNFSRK
jgi:alpha-1,2-mannosyltransferase